MSVPCLADRQYGPEDQQSFAALSADFNPLHIDPQVARRTMFGQCIVHGIHLLLWALEEWAKSGNGPVIEQLDVRLLKPAFLHEDIGLYVDRQSDDAARLTCRSGDARLCVINIKLGQDGKATGDASWQPSSRDRREQPSDPAPSDIAGMSGEVGLDATEGELRQAFPALTARMGAGRVAALLGLTRIVGMECPGLNSIFSSLSVRFDGPEGNRLAWNVTKANLRMSLISLAVEGGGLQGELVAFYRPPPQAPLRMGEIATAVEPGSASDRKALIVGGSRGLGRIAALMLAAGGGEVAVSYRTGRKEADTVAKEIAEAGGRAHCVSLDVNDPAPAIAELADAGFIPQEIYYFATPHIFVRKKALFEEDLFASFCDAYVSGLMRVVTAIRAHSDAPLRIFVPSSEALDEPLAELFEYALAKAAAETLAQLLPLFDKKVSVVMRRLPRLPTDQTKTLIEVPSADPVTTLSEVYVAMGNAPEQT